MVKAEASVTIARTAEDIFDFLADLENDQRWVKNWHSKRTSQSRELGATYARWYKFPFGKPMEAAVTVTSYERPRRFGFESRISSGVARIEFRLEPLDGAVRVTKVEELDHKGLLGFVNSLFGFALRSEAQKLMENLKRVLETTP